MHLTTSLKEQKMLLAFIRDEMGMMKEMSARMKKWQRSNLPTRYT